MQLARWMTSGRPAKVGSGALGLATQGIALMLGAVTEAP